MRVGAGPKTKVVQPGAKEPADASPGAKTTQAPAGAAETAKLNPPQQPRVHAEGFEAREAPRAPSEVAAAVPRLGAAGQAPRGHSALSLQSAQIRLASGQHASKAGPSAPPADGEDAAKGGLLDVVENLWGVLTGDPAVNLPLEQSFGPVWARLTPKGRAKVAQRITSVADLITAIDGAQNAGVSNADLRARLADCTQLRPELFAHFNTDAAFQQASAAVQKAFEHLTPSSQPLSPEVEDLYQATEDKILTRARTPSTDPSLRALKSIRTSTVFRSLPTGEQRTVLNVFAKLWPGGRKYLASLAHREHKDRPLLMAPGVQVQGPERTTLLQAVQRLMQEGVTPAFRKEGLTAPALAEQILQHIDQPGTIRQQDRGTCTVTTLQYVLADMLPGAFAEHCVNLVVREKTVFQDGVVAELLQNSIPKDSATGRSDISRIFQSNMMNAATSSDKIYNNPKDAFFTTDGEKEGSGLSYREEARVMVRLFGTSNLTFENCFSDDAWEMLKATTPSPKGPSGSLGLTWGKGGHAVAVVKIEGDRLFFRNPWGETTLAAGKVRKPPGSTIEDPKTGVESIDRATFEKLFLDATLIMPRDDTPVKA